MKRVVRNKRPNKKARKMIMKQRRLRLKISEVENLNKWLINNLMEGEEKLGKKETDCNILYEKNRKLRNEKAKKEEEIKMKDEEIEDLKNVVDKIKSKDIEIKIFGEET